MIRRGHRTDEVPPELLVYREAEWSSPEAWRSARSAWREVHRPRTIDDLNAFYGPDVVYPPRPDPREESSDA